MHIHPNAYFNHLKAAKAEYHADKKAVCDTIRDIYHELGGNVGHRFMKVFLERKHIQLSKTTVHKYMNKEMHLYYVARRKKPGYKKGNAHKLFPNLLNRKFVVNEPNKVWCTDFTYLYLTNGNVRYNCTIIDLYDRSVMASVNDKFITSNLAVRTLAKAIHDQKCDSTQLMLHSDQGVQFTSVDFTGFCEAHGITQSMSRAGTPYDNAPMERYYNTLKAELISQYNFRNDLELDTAINQFAYNWYNQVRPHSYNRYMTPYEKRSSFLE
jgi:putative transposase